MRVLTNTLSFIYLFTAFLLQLLYGVGFKKLQVASWRL